MCVSCLTPSNSNASARFVCRSNNPTNLHFSRYSNTAVPLSLTSHSHSVTNKMTAAMRSVIFWTLHSVSSNPVPTFQDKLPAQPSGIKKSNKNAGNNMAEKRKTSLHRGGSLKSRMETIAFLCSEFHINFNHL